MKWLLAKLRECFEKNERYMDREAFIFFKFLRAFGENELAIYFDSEKKNFVIVIRTESIDLSLNEMKNLLKTLNNWLKKIEKIYV